MTGNAKGSCSLRRYIKSNWAVLKWSFICSKTSFVSVGMSVWTFNVLGALWFYFYFVLCPALLLKWALYKTSQREGYQKEGKKVELVAGSDFVLESNSLCKVNNNWNYANFRVKLDLFVLFWYLYIHNCLP